MTTTTVLPETGTRVELSASAAADPVGCVRVVRTEGDLLTLALPQALAPRIGAFVTVRWAAGARGRFVLPAVVVAAEENRVDLQPAGEPTIEQLRRYVRGGGGEQVLMRRPGQMDTLGWIRDISEHSVRAHFSGVQLAPGDEADLLIDLDGEIIEVRATAVKAAGLPQRVPPGPMSVEVVAVFSAAEPQAKLIRRYVMRQQLLSRMHA
ncbi:hypothetical protein [Krasilnikovia sp. MM14-A1004]|uniref:hypothetical protein n=1 Tax=Krasilnikovia sp. MM14-A1004 TaxID=3373541 RepID=UPI00399CF551